ncbi:MAG: SCP2 sterol-binding domain-containing protein [Hyphomicrobiales bacterium]|nr:SCP2 sterol-binding domain-containing protein [Hyphomicrobiales bacterium]
MTEAALPRFPRLIDRVIGRLPTLPLDLAMRRFVGSLADRHPSLFSRLGEHATKRFLIEPTDLSLGFLLAPDPAMPRLEAVKRDAAGVCSVACDARIAGPLAALVGMVHGALDGDALFFSRDIVIEGDTEAVLALRNAVDDAEIDLAAEIAATTGPASPYVAQVLEAIRPAAERLTGVALGRPGAMA